MPSRSYVAPRDWARTPEAWPGGPWKRGTPRYAIVVAAIVTALQARLGDRALRRVAEEAGIAHTTLARLLAGRHVPDVGVVVALEDVLGVTLWPTRDEAPEKQEDR